MSSCPTGHGIVHRAAFPVASVPAGPRAASSVALVDGLRRVFSLVVLVAAGVVGVFTVPSAASADGVELKTAYAGPLAIRPTTTPGAQGPNAVCTADPRGKLWATDDYDPTVDAGWIENNPSSLDLVPDLQAGASRDLCAAFTLTPNVEPAITWEDNPWRVQDPAHPQPDVIDTHTYDLFSDNVVEGDDMRGVVVDLPLGYAGAPAAVPTCSETQFGLGNRLAVACADSTQLGDANVRLTLPFGRLVLHAALPIGKLYHLPAGPNELARLGAVVVPPDSLIAGVAPVKFTISLTLSPDGSGRLRATVKDAPRHIYGTDQLDADGQLLPGMEASFLPTYIEGIGIRVWGSRTEHPTLPADFGRSGTSCTTAAHGTFDVTTWQARQSKLDSAAFKLAGCDQLEFHPSVDVSTAERRPGVPTAATVKVGVGQESKNGLGTALLKDAAVELPAGLELGAQVGAGDSGLPLCTAGQFNRAAALAAPSCPAASAVADVRITTPLIDRPLVGKAYLGAQPAVGELPGLYVDAVLQGATAADAPRIKLVGTVKVDDQGRITATFDDNPQLRFSELALDFAGGPNALFVTPRACGTTQGTSSLTPWSGGPAVAATASLTIDQDCAAPAFAPTVSMAPGNPAAGASAPSTITVAREDRSPWLQGVKVALPSGFLADVGSVAECDAAAAAAANCPASTRMGTVRVTAGAGPDPLPLTGAIHMTAREPGAVAGAVIVVRAKIGELDLGDVVVPARIDLRPTDAGLTLTTTAPLRHRGLALNLRSIAVDLDRENFALNPSACGPLSLGATITSDAGESASPTSTVTYTGCDKLPFGPKLRATLTGDNRPGGHPGMYVELTSPAGESAMRSAIVTLPKGVAAALPNVQNPCSREQFDAVSCPANTRVGTATAHVSIAPEPVTGDIFLVRVPGKSLPGLGLNFTGRYAQRVVSAVQVDRTGRLQVSFAEIPDLPLRRLIVDVASNAKSPLQLPQGSCANGSGWNATFTAQGGQTAKADTGLQCAAPAEVRLTDKRGLTVRLFDLGSRKLQSAKATLPAGWRFDPKAAKRKNRAWVRMDGASASLKVTKTAVTAQAKKGNATTVRIKVDGAAVRPVTRAAKKAKKVVVPIRLAFTDGTVQTQESTVSVR